MLKQMNVTLTEEAGDTVQGLIDTGRYSNQSEVIRAAIFCLNDQVSEEEQKAIAWKKLNKMLADAEKGGHSDLTMDDILEISLKRIHEQKSPV